MYIHDRKVDLFSHYIIYIRLRMNNISEKLFLQLI